MPLPEEVGPEGIGFACMGVPVVNGRPHFGVVAWYPRAKKVRVVMRDRDGSARIGPDGRVLTMVFSPSSFDPAWKPGHGPYGTGCELCEPWREL